VSRNEKGQKGKQFGGHLGLFLFCEKRSAPSSNFMFSDTSRLEEVLRGSSVVHVMQWRAEFSRCETESMCLGPDSISVLVLELSVPVTNSQGKQF
jgi:hypothetical protein